MRGYGIAEAATARLFLAGNESVSIIVQNLIFCNKKILKSIETKHA